MANNIMDDENFIGIDENERGRSIYRIFPFKRVMELFIRRKLVLVNPHRWEDPFENFFLKCTVVDYKNNENDLELLRDSWYGLCWMLTSDSDAMWRIYSQDKNGVRIKTTIQKLASAVWGGNDDFASIKYFVGKVSYKSRKEIEDFLSKTSFTSLISEGFNHKFAETLLVKREEFAHENEVRALVNVPSKKSDARLEGDLYKVDIDPNDFIDEICMDPRVEKNEFDVMRDIFLQLGYAGAIVQSELYKFTPTKIKLI